MCLRFMDYAAVQALFRFRRGKADTWLIEVLGAIGARDTFSGEKFPPVCDGQQFAIGVRP